MTSYDFEIQFTGMYNFHQLHAHLFVRVIRFGFKHDIRVGNLQLHILVYCDVPTCSRTSGQEGRNWEMPLHDTGQTTFEGNDSRGVAATNQSC